MRISDWSSDVCSSDLQRGTRAFLGSPMHIVVGEQLSALRRGRAHDQVCVQRDRKSVVQGKSVSVRVDLGGRRSIKKKKTAPINLSEYYIDIQIYHITIRIIYTLHYIDLTNTLF